MRKIPKHQKRTHALALELGYELVRHGRHFVYRRGDVVVVAGSTSKPEERAERNNMAKLRRGAKG